MPGAAGIFWGLAATCGGANRASRPVPQVSLLRLESQRPIFHNQPLYSIEFARIGRDENEIPAEGLASDESVVLADTRTAPFERGANLSGACASSDAPLVSFSRAGTLHSAQLRGISRAPVRLATRSTPWLRHQDSSPWARRSVARGSA